MTEISRFMRTIFKPWNILDGREIVSCPWPESGRVYINARTIPGDPTSMRTFEIVNGRLESCCVKSKYEVEKVLDKN